MITTILDINNRAQEAAMLTCCLASEVSGMQEAD